MSRTSLLPAQIVSRLLAVACLVLTYGVAVFPVVGIAAAKASAETIELDFVLPFRDPVPVPHDLRTDMDCKSEIGFTISDAAYLRRDLSALLQARGITFTPNARYRLRLYLTHVDCGGSGEENYRSYPLGLGHSEHNFSSGYVRVLAEIVRQDNSEILSIREYISLAQIEETSSRFLFFFLGAESKQIQMGDLWQPVAKRIAEGIASDLGAK